MEQLRKLDYALEQVELEHSKLAIRVHDLKLTISKKEESNKIVDEWITDELRQKSDLLDRTSAVLKALSKKRVDELNKFVSELLNN